MITARVDGIDWQGFRLMVRVFYYGDYSGIKKICKDLEEVKAFCELYHVEEIKF